MLGSCLGMPGDRGRMAEEGKEAAMVVAGKVEATEAE